MGVGVVVGGEEVGVGVVPPPVPPLAQRLYCALETCALEKSRPKKPTEAESA